MKPCVRNYFTNIDSVRGQKDVVVGHYDGGTSVLSFFFPCPFQLVALATLDKLPSTAVIAYVNAKQNLPAAAVQAANIEWIQALFISMGFANAQPQGVSNGFTAYASEKFAEYMYNYLNPQIIGAYFNQFIAPGSEIIHFWEDEAAAPLPATVRERLRYLNEFILAESNKNLYGAPGLYEIFIDPSNTEPYYLGLKAYLDANANAVNFYVNEINTPALQDNINGNPLTNTINSINFAGTNPDAILWT